GAGAAFVLWLRKLLTRETLVLLGACAGAVIVAIGWQYVLYGHAGIPTPEFREGGILFSTMLLAFPLQWGLMAWGFGRYGRGRGLKDCFLLGWVLGWGAIAFSEPFYAYADRGMLTLQAPVTIIAGSIYFAWRPTVSLRHALIALAILVPGPLW